MSTTVSVAEQALWDIRRELGFDNDGDPTPAAMIAGMGRAGYAVAVLRNVQDYLLQLDIERSEAEGV